MRSKFKLVSKYAANLIPCKSKSKHRVDKSGLRHITIKRANSPIKNPNPAPNTSWIIYAGFQQECSFITVTSTVLHRSERHIKTCTEKMRQVRLLNKKKCISIRSVGNRDLSAEAVKKPLTESTCKDLKYNDGYGEQSKRLRNYCIYPRKNSRAAGRAGYTEMCLTANVIVVSV